jgi:hypothetical protein
VLTTEIRHPGGAVDEKVWLNFAASISHDHNLKIFLYLDQINQALLFDSTKEGERNEKQITFPAKRKNK